MKIHHLEKVIATFQFTIAAFILWFSIDSLSTTIKFWDQPAYYGGQKNSILVLFKIYHLHIIIGLLGLVSAIGLFFQKYWGWKFSTVTWNMFGIIIFISIMKLLAKKYNYGLFEMSVGIIISISFLIVGIKLLSTKFREKYKPTSLQLKIILSIIIFLTFDKIFVNR